MKRLVFLLVTVCMFCGQVAALELDTNNDGYIDEALIGPDIARDSEIHDDQTITAFSISGTTLTITLESGNTRTVNLASLQDGTGTDDQTISAFSLSGNILTITVEGGNTRTVDLSSLAGSGGTDDQIITDFSIVGTTLSITLEDGNTETVDISPVQDGTGTDDQTITDLSLSGNELTITIEGGNTRTVDLSAISGAGGIPDAPSDGTAYGRLDGAWVAVLQFYTETDPVFGAHAASGVTATRLTQWDAAYGWGDHGAAGYALLSSLGTAAVLDAGTSPNNLVQLGAACTVGDGAYTDQATCEANSGEWVGVLSVICDADTEDCNTKLDLLSAYEIDRRINAINAGASTMGDLADWPADVSATEVAALEGVTGNIQDQMTALSLDTNSITEVDTAPSSPSVNAAWILSTDNTLYVRGNGVTYSVALTVTPDTTGTVAISPTSWDPADGTEGDSPATQTFTVTATGDVDFTSYALGGSNYFTDLGTGTCTGTSSLSDSSCTINLQFSYAASGAYSDTLSIVSNATDSPETVSLGSTIVGAIASTPDPDYYWPFDDNAATTDVLADIGGIDAVLYNSGNTADIQTGTGFDLDSDSGRVAAAIPETVFYSGSFSIQADYKYISSTDTTPSLFNNGGGVDLTYYSDNSNFRLEMADSDQGYTAATYNLDDGQRHVVRLVYDVNAATAAIYAGINESSLALVHTFISVPQPTDASIDSSVRIGNGWDSEVSDWKIWASAVEP